MKKDDTKEKKEIVNVKNKGKKGEHLPSRLICLLSC